MAHNPVLARLGYGEYDRVVIIHADDIGMCQATVPAIADLFEFGLVSSASVMVPCPWFLEAAAYCREHPGVDVGVHLTLTSEWSTYRWGPLSTRDPASGLVDAAGYFWRDLPGIQEHGDPAAAEVELTAQVERALAAGIDVTHVDSHMGSVFHPKFVPGYVKQVVSRRIPAMFPRLSPEERVRRGATSEMIEAADRALRALADARAPTFDDIVLFPLDQPDERIDLAKHYFSQLKSGLTHWVIHPALDTPELRAIAPDCRSRVADHLAFASPALRDFVRDQGIQVIGYRALRDAMRS